MTLQLLILRRLLDLRLESGFSGNSHLLFVTLAGKLVESLARTGNFDYFRDHALLFLLSFFGLFLLSDDTSCR